MSMKVKEFGMLDTHESRIHFFETAIHLKRAGLLKSWKINQGGAILVFLG